MPSVPKADFPHPKGHTIEATMIQGNSNIGYAELNMTNIQINEERQKGVYFIQENRWLYTYYLAIDVKHSICFVPIVQLPPF